MLSPSASAIILASLMLFPAAVGAREDLSARDAGAAAAPTFETIWNLSFAVSPMRGYDGGVDLIANGTVYHRQVDTWVASASNATKYVGRNAAGELLYGSDATGDFALTHRGEGMTTPVAPHIGHIAFGGDGALYGIRQRGWPAELVRIHENRTIERVAALPAGGDLLAAPDGQLYVVGAQTLRVDLSNGSSEVAPELAGVRAFDAEGNGYRILNRTLVARIGPNGENGTVVARSPMPLHDLVGGLVGSGTRFWAYAPRSDGLTLLSVDVGIPMFEGFRGAFQPEPAPDLRVAGVEEERMGISLQVGAMPGEDIRHRVTVRNDGLGRARATEMYAYTHCPGCWELEEEPSRIIPVPALEAGESVVLSIDWHATVPGDRSYNYLVDMWREEAETNELNNGMRWDGYALVDAA